MVLIGSVRCKKFKQDIVARTFALIAPVWLVLQQVLCCSKMEPNAHKRSETHKTMSLGSNGVDREHLLRKIQAKHRGTNCCINCTSLSRFLSAIEERTRKRYEQSNYHSMVEFGIHEDSAI